MPPPFLFSLSLSQSIILSRACPPCSLHLERFGGVISACEVSCLWIGGNGYFDLGSLEHEFGANLLIRML